MLSLLGIYGFWAAREQSAAFVAFAVPGLLACRALFLRSRPDRRIVRMAHFPSPVTQFPVDIVLYRSGYRYAEDSGLISFVDGWLLFEGERTTFSLAARDTGFAEAGQRATKIPDHRYRYWVVPILDGKAFEVGIRPLDELGDGSGRISRALCAEFSVWIYGWRRTKGPKVGASLYPPIVPNDLGDYAARRCLWLALATYSVASVSLAVSFVGFVMGTPLSLTFAGVALCAGIIGAVCQSRFSRHMRVFDELRDRAR